MPKISYIKIENFRKLKNFEYQFTKDANIVCIIGRGDSGKSTLLEAISLVLSPSWNVVFNDTDFSNMDVSIPIRIEAIVYDLPDSLYSLNGAGFCSIFLNPKTLMEEEPCDSSILALRIILTVSSDLEPSWSRANSSNELPIGASNRSKLNVFLVSDFIDRHFSWNKGTPLAALFKKELKEIKTGNEPSGVIEIFRTVKESIDEHKFEKFASIESKFIKTANKYGASLQEIKTSIDWKDLQYNEGRLCLHEEKIPFRLKGKGTKRLLSIALQLSLIENSGIILIDEIEQGLEPDRVRQLVSILKKESNAQIIITTHSSNAVVELESNDLYRMKGDTIYNLPKDNTNQSLARTNPEAFFAKRLIVAEGATEVGLMRAVNEKLISEGTNFSAKNIGIVDGKGSSMINYCGALLQAGYEVCLICDNDRTEDQKNKQKILEKGAFIIQPEEDLCLEQQIFNNVSEDSVNELFEFGKRDKVLKILRKRNLIDIDNNLIDYTLALRELLGKIAGGKENEEDQSDSNKGELKKLEGWFKTVSYGEDLGTIIFKDRINFQDNHLGVMFSQLYTWINNA
ncbi:MAG: AAA family ATPase [Prolixibacteraceae bacterium]|nr:AAA family ATPase [Prolixibacteraceae bacterium]